jgi:hypothetical protein
MTGWYRKGKEDADGREEFKGTVEMETGNER